MTEATTPARSVLLPGFVGTTLPPWVERALRDGLAGVCLFAINIDSPGQLRTLTAAVHDANPDAIVAIDEEGGDVSRLHQAAGSPFPGNAVLGRLDDLELTERVATQVGWELRDVGVDLALAPVVDVNADPRNPVIGVRSFGADAGAVAEHGAAWVRGVQSTGVAACAKHFPGHGDTSQDSHLARPTVGADEATIRRRDLPPFAAAVAAGTHTIMTSHVLAPALDPHQPATFSRAVLRDLLRGDLGFEGVVVSDALDMVGASGDIGIPAAAVRAVSGGCDLLCLGPATTEHVLDGVAAALTEAVTTGDLDPDDLADASRRVQRLGTALAGSRGDRALPTTFAPGRVPSLGARDVAPAITVSAAARATLAGATDVAWVRLEGEPNIAVGASPWGPFALGVEATVTVAPGEGRREVVDAVPDGATAVVVGRDIHRHAHARQVVADLRRAHPTVVVDMGWPGQGDDAPDVATHGASRLVSAALLHALGLDGVDP